MFCPKCGAQLPDGSVFCSACGTQLAQQVNAAADQVAQQAAPEAQAFVSVAPAGVPKANSAAKLNILGAALTVLLFFSLLMPFQAGGSMFITKPEGWIMILVVGAAAFCIFMKQDSLFTLVSVAAFALCFISLFMIAVGVHGGSGNKDVDDFLGALAAISGEKVSIPGSKTPGFGVTFALTCSLGMFLSPIINRLFAKRK